MRTTLLCGAAAIALALGGCSPTGGGGVAAKPKEDAAAFLSRAEKELSLTIKEHKADIAVLSGQLDRVESVRSQYNKTRVLMLYRMHLLLTAEQRTKLEALRARRDADRRDRRHP